jgi:ABC-type uncharacterized transport system ATPase subunit
LVAYCFYDDKEVALLDPVEKRLRKMYKEIRETGKMITFECHRWDYYNKVSNASKFLNKVVLHAKRTSKGKEKFKRKIFEEMKNNPKWDR